jgi:hypothetical protein
MTTESSDFSRFELMLIHRLSTLEQLTKEQHQAFEDLRVDFVTHKSAINTRFAIYGTVISAVVTLANLLLHFI